MGTKVGHHGNVYASAHVTKKSRVSSEFGRDFYDDGGISHPSIRPIIREIEDIKIRQEAGTVPVIPLPPLRESSLS